MPVKTAKRKLLLPILGILILLGALAFLCRPRSTDSFSIDHGGELYLPLAGGLAALSPSGISVYSPDGELLFSKEQAMDTALTATDGQTLAAVSEGRVLVYSQKGETGAIDPGGETLALDIRGKYLALARRDSLYQSAVTFYEGTAPLFTVYLAKGECEQVLLADDFAALLLPEEIQILRSPEEVVKIPLTGAKKLHPAYGGVCAETGEALRFYSPSGEHTGTYTGGFFEARSFNDKMYILTGDTAAVIEPQGKIGDTFTHRAMLGFGSGEKPAVITGEEVFVFDEKMKFLYSVENKYKPLNVITDKSGAVLCWQDAAQIHRK